MMCDDDSDNFRVTPDADCTLDLSLDFDHTIEDNLTLRLYTNAGVLLDQSFTQTDNESIQWPTTGEPYIINISGSDNGFGTPYALTANQTDCVVTPDCEEFGEPNDYIDDGYVIDTLPLEFASAELCDTNEDDWYSIQTTAGCLITVELEFTHTASSDLDFTVLNADGSIAMEAGSGSSNEFASDYAGSDILDLRVFGYASDDFGPYLLSITEDCPVIEDCVEDAFEANNDRFNPPPPGVSLPFNDTLNFCSADELEEEDWFAVEAEEGCVIQAEVTGDDATRLVITDTFNSIHSAASSGPILQTELTATNTGTHKVGVFGTTGPSSDYDLSIELECPPGECVEDEWEENGDGVSNDDQATATPITGTQFLDVELCGPDEDWYAFPFESGCKLGVEVSYDKFDTGITAELLNGTSRRGSYVEGLNGTSIVYSPRTTGTVHLRVDALEDESYSVSVDQFDCPAHVCEVDASEPNDTVDVARVLPLNRSETGSLCDDGDVDVWTTSHAFTTCPTIVNVDIAPPALVRLIDDSGDSLLQMNTTNPIGYIAREQHVVLLNGSGSEYRIRSETKCDDYPTCPDDDLFAPNWQTDQAPLIVWGANANLVICNSADYLRLPPVPAGCTGTVEIGAEGNNRAYGTITDEDGAAVGAMIRISGGSSDFIGETSAPRWVLVQKDSGFDGAYNINTLLECE
jgi:hypothetical protein